MPVSEECLGCHKKYSGRTELCPACRPKIKCAVCGVELRPQAVTITGEKLCASHRFKKKRKASNYNENFI